MPLVEIWLITSFVGLIGTSIGAILAVSDVRMALDLAGQTKDSGFVLVAGQRLFAQVIRLTGFAFWSWLGLLVLGHDIEVSAGIVMLILANIAFTVVAISDTVVGLILRRRVEKRRRTGQAPVADVVVADEKPSA